jgi:hypothetical protein
MYQSRSVLNKATRRDDNKINDQTAESRMHRTFLIIGILALVAAAGGSAQSRALTSQDDPLVKIETDYQAGVISVDDRAIMVANAIRKPESLPSKYQISASTGETPVLPSRSATLALLAVWRSWDSLSVGTQQIVAQILTRWSTVFTYDSPGGFFKLHYDTTGTHAVPAADGNGNGIPDYIDKAAAYLDSTLVKHVALGFLTPPSDGGVGGDARFDVYFENMVYYGYAQPENFGPNPWNDATSYLVLHRNFLGFPSNLDPEGNQYGAMKVTIGHEFHHCVQFAYDYGEYSWFMELDATYTEDVICPLTHDNYNYLSSFFSAPATSQMDESIHMYACYIWGKFLHQNFDQALMRQVWEGARYGTDIYTTLSDTLQARFGWSQDSAFAQFALWNYITSSRDDGLHYTDAANYPLISIGRSHTSYPTGTVASPNNPAGYAASYVRFYPTASTGTLRITFDGDNSRQWAAWVIKTTGSNSYQFQQVPLAPVTFSGQLDIPNFQSYSNVMLVGINLSEFSAAATFNYSAQIKSVYSISSQILTDSMVYSGSQRLFSYKLTNNAPLDDVVRVSASDTKGWISYTPFDQAVLSGQSVIVTIPVKPAVGTALGTHSDVTLVAKSRSDTTVVDTARTTAVTVLHIGDVDFDGAIDISDLTALIGYLYLEGNPPAPLMQAGNLDCEGKVDISDLSVLISFLYLAGPPCACNPF